LDVSKSGYHVSKDRPKSRRTIDNEVLLIEIRRVFVENRENYGSPRIWDALHKVNIPCSLNRVTRLMHENGIVAIQRRKFRATTDSKHNWPVAPNVLERNFTTDGPNKIWVTDITYVWTGEGWLYLSFVLDLFSRGVVGLAMSERITGDLTQSALKQALGRRNPPAGLIHHSDRGSQYASHAYQRLLQQFGMVSSMSRKGNCWDNGVPRRHAEGFIPSCSYAA